MVLGPHYPTPYTLGHPVSWFAPVTPFFTTASKMNVVTPGSTSQACMAPIPCQYLVCSFIWQPCSALHVAGPVMGTGGTEVGETGHRHQGTHSLMGKTAVPKGRSRPRKEFCALCCGAGDQRRHDWSYSFPRLQLLSYIKKIPGTNLKKSYESNVCVYWKCRKAELK